MANFITIVVAICLFICQPTIVIDLGVLLSVLEKEKSQIVEINLNFFILRVSCTLYSTATYNHD